MLKDSDFNKEIAVGILQAVGDRRLSLTIINENTYVITLIIVYILCIAIIGVCHRNIDDAQTLLDALCLVTLPGLIELK